MRLEFEFCLAIFWYLFLTKISFKMDPSSYKEKIFCQAFGILNCKINLTTLKSHTIPQWRVKILTPGVGRYTADTLRLEQSREIT